MMFRQKSCQQLHDNLIGEGALFTNGMTLLELMHSYLTDSLYLQGNTWGKEKTNYDSTMKENDGRIIERRNWTLGYCMHSDWMWGYFFNYYPVTDHSQNPKFKEVLNDHLIGYKNSEISVSRTRQFLPTSQCLNEYDPHCTASAHLCHRISPEHMYQLHHNITSKNERMMKTRKSESRKGGQPF
jgi:hypothetical protein